MTREQTQQLAEVATRIQNATGVSKVAAIDMASHECLIVCDRPSDRAAVEYEMQFLAQAPRSFR